MRILMLLGWRNLLRRKWRTAATDAMLFTGAVLLVFLTGMGEGTYSAMVRLSTNTFFGDFQVLHSDYNSKPGLYKNVTNYLETGETLQNNPHVKGISSCRSPWLDLPRKPHHGWSTHRNRTP